MLISLYVDQSFRSVRKLFNCKKKKKCRKFFCNHSLAGLHFFDQNFFFNFNFIIIISAGVCYHFIPLSSFSLLVFDLGLLFSCLHAWLRSSLTAQFFILSVFNVMCVHHLFQPLTTLLIIGEHRLSNHLRCSKERERARAFFFSTLAVSCGAPVELLRTQSPPHTSHFTTIFRHLVALVVGASLPTHSSI